MSRFTAPALAVVIAIGAAVLASGQQAPTAAAPGGDQQAVGQVSQEFVKAFNAGKAEEIAGLFHGGAELIDDAGNRPQGRRRDQGRLRPLLREVSRGDVDHDRRLRLDGRPVAGDRGGPTGGVDEGRPGVRGLALHAGDDEAAKASGRSRPAARWRTTTSLSPHDRLQPLAWLVGDWVDEGSDAVVQISCKWSEDKNYLLVDFQCPGPRQARPEEQPTDRLGSAHAESQVLGVRLRRRPRRGDLVAGRGPLGDQVHRRDARRTDRLGDDRAGAARQGLATR